MSNTQTNEEINKPTGIYIEHRAGGYIDTFNIEEDLDINWTDVESYRVRYNTMYLEMKNGDSLEYDSGVIENAFDGVYKWLYKIIDEYGVSYSGTNVISRSTPEEDHNLNKQEFIDKYSLSTGDYCDMSYEDSKHFNMPIWPESYSLKHRITYRGLGYESLKIEDLSDRQKSIIVYALKELERTAPLKYRNEGYWREDTPSYVYDVGYISSCIQKEIEEDYNIFDDYLIDYNVSKHLGYMKKVSWDPVCLNFEF